MHQNGKNPHPFFHPTAIQRLHNANNHIPDVVTHWTGYFSPRNDQVGGAQVALGDGAVRFLSDSIDQDLHRALHSINGGEVIGEF